MIELYKEFKKLIHVSDYSYHRFHSFIQPLENLITTDISLTDIHFCSVRINSLLKCIGTVEGSYKVFTTSLYISDLVTCCLKSNSMSASLIFRCV